MHKIDDIIIFSPVKAGAQRLTTRFAPHTRHIRQAETADQTLAHIGDGAVEAVLIDLTDAAYQGLDLAMQIRGRHADLPLVALGDRKDPDLILAALRAGMNDFVVLNGNGATDLSVFEQALGRAKAVTPGELIAVFSLKGGQGVTAVALNLADCIASIHHGKVLLADFNLYRGDAAACLNRTCDFTPFDLVRDLQRMDDHLLFSSLDHYKNRFHLLGAGSDISDADQISTDAMCAMIDLLRRHFSTVVMDMPCDCSEKSLAVLAAADRIILIVQQRVPEIQSLQSVLHFFHEIQPGDPRLRLVINRFDPNSDLAPRELADLLGCDVTATIANDYRALTEAADRGLTLTDAFPNKRITRDLRTLAARLTGTQAPSTAMAFLQPVFDRLFNGRPPWVRQPDGRP